MGYLDVHPHEHELQGWATSITAGGQTAGHHGIGQYAEAASAARERGLKLRIGPEARAQMESAGCGPARWPQGIGCGLRI
jgi:hypothetical protein